MKKYLLSIFLLVLAGTCSWLYVALRSNPVEIPIRFSDAFLPLVNLQIQGEEYPLELSLSSKYPAYLNQECLEGMQKTHKGEAHWNQLDGNTYSAPLYELPHTSLGTLKLYKLLAVPQDCMPSESVGSLLWPFKKGNLVLDFPHNAVWGVKRARDLHNLGLDPNKMLKVQTEKGPKRDIIIPVMTELGELRMGLSTSFNKNVISDKLWKGDRFTSSLAIGGQDCGLAELYPFQIPEVLELDGFLGNEFFVSHIVYIDQGNECLYIGEETGNTLYKKALVKLPIQFTCSNLPVTDFKMGTLVCKALIDLGSCREVTLSGVSFNFDDFRHLHTTTVSNVWGNEAEEQVYCFPSYQLGKTQVQHIEFSVHEYLNHSAEIEMEPAEGSDPSLERHANVGRPLLYRSNLYFDFPNAACYLVDREASLKKLGVDLREFNKTPYAHTPFGIGVDVWVDGEKFHFFLDTGATGSAINTTVSDRFPVGRDKLDNVCHSGASFKVGEIDYGEQILYPIKLGSRWEYDGILGMDFLRKHPFYIDHLNRVIYFEKPKNDPST